MSENVVARATAEIDPEINRRGANAFKKQLHRTSTDAMQGVASSLQKEFGKLPKESGLTQAMRKQRQEAVVNARSISSVLQKESRSWASLQGQKAKAMDASASKMREEARSWSSLQSQKAKAIEASSKRQKLAMQDVSRSFDTQLILAKTALRRGTISNKEYQKSTESIMGAARNAGLGLDDIARKMDRVVYKSSPGFGDALRRGIVGLDQFSSRLGIMAYQLSMVGRTMTTAFTAPVVAGLTAATTIGIKAAASLEASFMGLQSLNPGKNITPFFREMVEFAKKSPVFEVAELMRSIQQLSAAKMPVDKIRELVHAMGRLGLTTAMTGPQMTRAFTALIQMMNKGYTSAEELRGQLGEALPGAFALVADGLGITQKALSKALEPLSKTRPTAEQAVNALIKMSKTEKYIKGAAAGTQTLNAAWESLKETVKITLAEQFLDKNFRVKPEILKMVDGLRDSVTRLISSLSKAGVFQGIIKGAGVAADKISMVVNRFQALSDAEKQLVVRMSLFAAAVGPATMALAPMLNMFATGTSMASLLGRSVMGLGGVMGPVAVLVGGAAAAFAGLIAVGLRTSEVFRKHFAGALRDFGTIFDTRVMPAINAFWTQLQKLGQEVAGMFGKNGGWDLIGSAVASSIRHFGTFLMVIARVGQAITFFVRTSIMAIKMWATLFSTVWAKVADVIGKVADMAGFDEISKKAYAARDGLIGFSAGLNESLVATGPVTEANWQLSGSMYDLSNRFAAGQSAASQFGSKVDQLRDKIQGLDGTTKSLSASEDEWIKAKLSASETLAQNKGSLDKNTRAGQNNRDAIKAAMRAENLYTAELIRSQGPTKSVIAGHNKRVAALVAEIVKAGGAKKSTEQYARSLDQIPRNVASLIKMVGLKGIYTELETLQIAQLTLKNGGDGKKAKAEYNKLIGIRGNLQDLYRTGKGFHAGGWTGPGSKMQPAGVVHADEHVIRKESRQRMEAAKPGLLDYINRTGHLPPQYDKGGTVQQWTFPMDMTKTMVNKSWKDQGFGPGGAILSGGGGGKVGGYQAMMSWLKKAMGGQVSMSSGYRPGDPGYHGSGRAADLIFPDGSQNRGGGLALKAFNLIKSNFMKNIKELIWDFAGKNAVWNGQNHFFTGGGAGPGTHNDHIHWAMDNGGPWAPDTSAINLSGKPELALNNPQAQALEDRIRGPQAVNVKVYVGDKEIKDIVKVEVNQSNKQMARTLKGGRWVP